MVKFKFHNFRQVICACKNHVEALLQENKNFRLDHYICTVNQYAEYDCKNHNLRVYFDF